MAGWEDLRTSEEDQKIKRIKDDIYELDLKIAVLQREINQPRGPQGSMSDYDTVADPLVTEADRQRFRRAQQEALGETSRLTRRKETLEEEKNQLQGKINEVNWGVYNRWIQTPTGKAHLAEQERLKREKQQQEAARRAALHPLARYLEDHADTILRIGIIVIIIVVILIVWDPMIRGMPWVLKEIFGFCPHYC